MEVDESKLSSRSEISENIKKKTKKNIGNSDLIKKIDKLLL